MPVACRWHAHVSGVGRASHITEIFPGVGTPALFENDLTLGSFQAEFYSRVMGTNVFRKKKETGRFTQRKVFIFS